MSDDNKPPVSSVRLDPTVLERLRKYYPNDSTSVIVRIAMARLEELKRQELVICQVDSALAEALAPITDPRDIKVRVQQRFLLGRKLRGLGLNHGDPLFQSALTAYNDFFHPDKEELHP
jgi:hypothetical protein